MKKKTILNILFGLILGTSPAFSQDSNGIKSKDFYHGVSISGGASSTYSEYDSFNHYSWNFGYNVYYDLYKRKNWYAESGVFFSYRNHLIDGASLHYGSMLPYSIANTYNISTGYLSIPIGTRLNYTFLKTDFIASMGINTSFLLFNYQTNREIETLSGEIIPEGSSLSYGVFNPIDFSVYFNKGVEIDCSKFFFIPSIYFQFGLTDIGGNRHLEGWYVPGAVDAGSTSFRDVSWRYSYIGINLEVVFK